LTTYEDLEDQIVTRLSLIGSSVFVRPQPENELEGKEQDLQKPRVTVSYQHSEFSGSLTRGLPEMLSTAEAVQDEFVELNIVIEARLLRGNNGMYKAIKDVVEKLFGFVPENWGKCFLKTGDYLDNSRGHWTWSIIFVTRRTIVEVIPESNDPLLN